MTPSIHIDIADGSVKLLGSQHTICRGASQASVEAMLCEFQMGAVDHGNGYSWLNFHGLTFGEMPCGLALLFHQKKLTEVHFSVALPNAPLESGWPTRAAIDDEIEFVRKIFRAQLKRRFRNEPEQFRWGVAWSEFDSKGFRATAGIRYA
jgi:hypothetical protein